MKGRGWKEVEAHEDWDFFYADVGWIHENITYAQVHAPPGAVVAAVAQTLSEQLSNPSSWPA